MRAKKNHALRALLTAVLVFLMVLYVGYQAYRSIFSEIVTEMAVTHSVYETIDAQGLVFRSESVINTTGSGYTYSAVLPVVLQIPSIRLVLPYCIPESLYRFSLY